MDHSWVGDAAPNAISGAEKAAVVQGSAAPKVVMDATQALGILEDEKGTIVASNRGDVDGSDDEEGAAGVRKRRKLAWTESSKGSVVRDMIRSVYLLVDCSKEMKPKHDSHLRPNKPRCVNDVVRQFAKDFFNQNPISQLGLVVLRGTEDGGTGAEILQPLTCGNASLVPNRLSQILSNTSLDCRGTASLQKGLEVCLASMSTIPSHLSKEIVVLFASTSTDDEGVVSGQSGGLIDGNSTVSRLRESSVRVSVVCLEAEVYVCRKVSNLCHGSFSVPLSRRHLQSILSSFTQPPPTMSKRKTATLVEYGFPILFNNDVPTLVADPNTQTSSFSLSGYRCPRCHTMLSTVPCTCIVCGLSLILSTHLSRSHHHLFPVPPYVETTVGTSCHSCLKTFNKVKPGKDVSKDEMRFKCAQCGNIYCVYCDEFVHSRLFSCPGCLLR